MHEQDKSDPFRQYDVVCVLLCHFVNGCVDKKTGGVCHGIQEIVEKL